MTSQAPESSGVSLVERRTSENVNTMMFRTHATARGLAPVVGIPNGTLSRKLRQGGWTLSDLVVLSRHFRVTLDELTGELPTLTAWTRREGMRKGPDDGAPGPFLLPHLDSNQEPSGYRSAQVIALASRRGRNPKVKGMPRLGKVRAGQ